VLELYPGVKISIGPPIEDGFYYDFDFPDGTKLTEDDFERIEAKMREHVKADEHFEREEVIKFFSNYKQKLLKGSFFHYK
jgi:threonyl-tRNA synthetase